MAPYQYEPLSSPTTQIRLLELLPGRRVIECRLKVAELELEKGTYEPISYCWKSYSRRRWPVFTYKLKKKQKSVRVLIDGASLHISESLHEALRRMRLKTRVRVLWADAICINQTNDEEKSAQVAMMGRIYQGGEQTLVWLGKADCWTAMAFSRLNKVLSRTSDSEDSDSSNPLSEQPDAPDYHFGNFVPRLHGSRQWRRLCAVYQNALSYFSFRSILHRPYFERAWIVQEIVLSDKVMIMCGKYEIAGLDLYNGLEDCDTAVPSRANLIRHSIGDLWDNPGLYCLHTIMNKLSHTKTSDPRDKLYSALGLHQECTEYRYRPILVDYSRDVSDVFFEATKLMLSSSPFLDLLSMSYGTSRVDGMDVPSWVWNPEPRSSQFHLTAADDGAQYPYCASQSWQSRPQFQHRLLGLLGYALDTVHIVGEVSPIEPSSYFRHSFISKAVRCYFSWMLVSGMYEPGITDEELYSRSNAFRCILKPLKEKFATTEEAGHNWTDDQDAWYFAMFHEELIEYFGKFLSPGSDKTSIRRKLGLLAATTKFQWKLLVNLTVHTPWLYFWYPKGGEAVYDRCLVRSEKGLIALCPRGTMKNDKIVLLQGANVPFVLRPSGDNWVLVGECYMYEAMYGHLWDQDRCEMLWIE